MMTVFTSAAVLALVIGPTCGGVPTDSDLAQHLVATVMTESAGDQYAIGVNADLDHGLPAQKISPATLDDAVNLAAVLIARGRSIDLGLSQINSRNLERHHLTIETAFDKCANIRAGAEHLLADHDWVLAHRRYNSGSTERGIAYADRVVARISAVSPTVIPPSLPAAEEDDLNDHPAGPQLYLGNEE